MVQTKVELKTQIPNAGFVWEQFLWSLAGEYKRISVQNIFKMLAVFSKTCYVLMFQIKLFLNSSISSIASMNTYKGMSTYSLDIGRKIGVSTRYFADIISLSLSG